jgi:hypothetical protein
MDNISITVSKTYVLSEVQKDSAYIATRKADGIAGYDRISATDYEADLFERYFRETGDVVTALLREYIVNPADAAVSLTGTKSDYKVTLRLPSNFDSNMVPSMQSDIAGIFVSSILGKWLNIVDKDSAEAASSDLATKLAALKQKLYHRKRPTR